MNIPKALSVVLVCSVLTLVPKKSLGGSDSELPLLDLKAFIEVGLEDIKKNLGENSIDYVHRIAFQDAYAELGDGKFFDASTLALLVKLKSRVAPQGIFGAYAFHLNGYSRFYLAQQSEGKIQFFDHAEGTIAFRANVTNAERDEIFNKLSHKHPGIEIYYYPRKEKMTFKGHTFPKIHQRFLSDISRLTNVSISLRPIELYGAQHFADAIDLDIPRLPVYKKRPIESVTRLVALDEFRTITKGLTGPDFSSMQASAADAENWKHFRANVPQFYGPDTQAAIQKGVIDLRKFTHSGTRRLSEEFGKKNIDSIRGVFFVDGAVAMDMSQIQDYASLNLLANSKSLPKNMYLVYQQMLSGETNVRLAKMGRDDRISFARANTGWASFDNVAPEKAKAYVETFKKIHPNIKIKYHQSIGTIIFEAENGREFLDFVQTALENKTIKLRFDAQNYALPFEFSRSYLIDVPIYKGQTGFSSIIIAPDDFRTLTRKLKEEGREFKTETTLPSSFQPRCQIYLVR